MQFMRIGWIQKEIKEMYSKIDPNKNPMDLIQKIEEHSLGEHKWSFMNEARGKQKLVQV